MTSLEQLTRLLDEEFPSVQRGEDLTSHAVTEDNRRFINPAFLSLKTNLMTTGSPEIDQVSTVVFITETVADKLLAASEPQLIFTHHPFDYFEDQRGIVPIATTCLERLSARGHALFSCHAGLDTHSHYGTSRALAELLNITVDEEFYDYFGAPAAVTGHLPQLTDYEQFSLTVQEKLQRPFVTKVQHRKTVKKVAVAAGGGELPDVLQMAYDRGCDTLLTGTVEHRWGLPGVQENNRAFHQLNESLGLNLVGGTHFGTERPALIRLLDYFGSKGIVADYIEDEQLLNAT